jgi:hypothetical protein
MGKPHKTINTTIRNFRVKVNIFLCSSDPLVFEGRASCPVCHTTLISSRKNTENDCERVIKTNVKSHLRDKHLKK